MKHAKRIDSNQPVIVKQLRELGFTVYLTHKLGNGFPDFIVGFYGINYLVELKSKSGKLTADEIKFADEWLGQVNTHYTLLEILNGFLKHICYIDGFNVTYKQIKLNNIILSIKNETTIFQK